jgi:hypothetical protein
MVGLVYENEKNDKYFIDAYSYSKKPRNFKQKCIIKFHKVVCADYFSSLGETELPLDRLAGSALSFRKLGIRAL